MNITDIPEVKEASALFDKAAALISTDPAGAEQALEDSAKSCPEVWVGLSTDSLKDRKWAAAAQQASTALAYAKRPRTIAAAWNNLGAAKERMGDRAGAESCFLEGIKHDKANPDLFGNLGMCRQWAGDIPASQWNFSRALKLSAGHYPALFGRAVTSLLAGEYSVGFRQYEARFLGPLNDHRPKLRPEWNGQCLAGKRILFYAEQGMGDVIQMARYIPDLQRQSKEVIALLQKPLVPLFRNWFPGMRVFAEGDGVPDFDYQIACMSLPHRFKTTTKTIPPPVPNCWTPRSRPRMRVGLAWAGSADHEHDLYRSIDFAIFAGLMDAPVDFENLQVGNRSNEPLLAGVGFPAVDLASFLDTQAVVLSGLDLVITVDTSLVHLCGSLGVPTWCLVASSPDWRWMLKRTDSPWYPSVRLFRQKTSMDWKPVIESVRDALHKEASVIGGRSAESLVNLPPAGPLVVQQP